MDVSNLNFSNHLIQRMKERALNEEWILDAVSQPDEKINIAEDEVHFYKIISHRNAKWLKVIVNPLNKTVVTAFFDRNKKNKDNL